MKISVILPTRKRTKHVTILLNSIAETATNLNKIEVIFVVDDDDKESIDYFKNVNEKYEFDIKHVIVPRLKYIFSDLWNQALPVSTGELYLSVGDDIVFRTKDWDRMIVDEYEQVPDKILLLHFNDLTGHASRLAGFWVMHKNWVNVVGYFSPPWFDGDWGDWWVTHLGDGVRRRKYRDDIVIEHLNISFGKNEPDETFYQHKIRREAFGSPDSNSEHPFNTKKHIKQKNIQDLCKFVNNYQQE